MVRTTSRSWPLRHRRSRWQVSRFIFHTQGRGPIPEPGSDSTFSAPSGGPHSGSVGSAPGTPDVLAHWEALIGLPQPGPESESEPGSSRHSTPPPSPPPPHPDELAAAPENPKADTFFNDALKQKIKIIGGLGAVLGVSGSVIYGLHKLIGSPQACVSSHFPLTSNRVTNILTCDLPQQTRW